MRKLINIISLIHCATRLRFTLKNEAKADDAKAKNISGILSLVKKGGQYQLVIGNHVHEVYLAIMKLADIKEGAVQEEREEKTSFVNKALSAITGSVAPALPVIAGAGMGKVVLLLLTLMGIVSSDSQTYAILSFIFDTGFYFMPVFVAFSAAKIFKCNEFLGAFLALTLLHPNWVAMVAAGQPVEFFGLPVTLAKYASSIIPILLSVWAMSYIEKFARKIVPDIIKVFAVPLLVMLVSVPLALIVIGPVGNYLSQIMATIVSYMQANYGFLAVGILCAIYPWLVTTGMHTAITPIGINLLAETGCDPITRTLTLCHGMSQGSAALAVALKTKNKELRSLALSSSMTALLGGITEPVMYGVNLRLKKPMYACMIGAAAAGLFAGFVQLKAYAMALSSLLSLPMWVPAEGRNFIYAIITIIIAIVVTFIATLIIGFDDPETGDKEIKKVENEKINLDDKISVSLGSPLTGKTVALDKIADETFASGIMGKGIGIIPSEGKVYAPTDAVVSAAFNTAHAIGLTTKEGVELLIHVGIDTVALEGKYFDLKVEKDQEVKKGDLLLEFDMEKIAAEGYDLTTMFIVTNSDQYLEILPADANKDNVKALENLITII